MERSSTLTLTQTLALSQPANKCPCEQLYISSSLLFYQFLHVVNILKISNDISYIFLELFRCVFSFETDINYRSKRQKIIVLSFTCTTMYKNNITLYLTENTINSENLDEHFVEEYELFFVRGRSIEHEHNNIVLKMKMITLYGTMQQ
jgi:hypothetical protein